MDRVCAVVVTYNRPALLAKCLDSIMAQSFACADILVVDNASARETQDLLRSNQYSKVSTCRLKQNVGAAGGFSMGMHLAFRCGADLIWVMDDDVIPEPDALENLLRANELLKDRGIEAPFVVSTARAPGGQLTNVPEVANNRNGLNYGIWPDLLDHGIVPVRSSSFVSILLPRQTLADHGLPLASMFIWGEDVEYAFRVTKSGPGYMTGLSRVQHVRATAGRLSLSTETNSQRVDWHWYLLRNTVFTTRTYSGWGRLCRYVYFQMRTLLALVARGQFRRARVLYSGVFAGFFFRPKYRRADADVPSTNIQYLSPGFPVSIASAIDPKLSKTSEQNALLAGSA